MEVRTHRTHFPAAAITPSALRRPSPNLHLPTADPRTDLVDACNHGGARSPTSRALAVRSPQPLRREALCTHPASSSDIVSIRRALHPVFCLQGKRRQIHERCTATSLPCSRHAFTLWCVFPCTLQEKDIDQAKMQVQGQLAAQYIQDVMQVRLLRLINASASKRCASRRALPTLTGAENHRQVLHPLRRQARRAARRL